jgi:16S rRNA (guanine966-N2)-methyltransferase
MRIVAGDLKGRVLADPKSHRTHPMSEKIRGALFNVLGELSGLTVLDAFTGSGAVAIEAISRGAAHVMAIDLDIDAYKCAAGNVTALKLNDKITVLRTNAKSWSNGNLDKLYDIVIADPPFDVVNDALLEKIARHTKSDGLFVISIPSDYIARKNPHFTELLKKEYGDATLVFYKRIHQ